MDLATILRRSTTKPVWWFERKRPYPIRSTWSNLPPVPVSTNSNLKLLVLATPHACNEAAWCCWSWAKNCGIAHALELRIDGTCDERFAKRLSAVVPGTMTSSIRIRDEDWSEYPHLLKLARSHPLGRKLLTLLDEQTRSDLLYADFDVLLFRRPENLVAQIKKRQACYNQEGATPAYDSSVLKSGSGMGLKPSDRLNSGLLYIPKCSFSLEIAERLIATKSPTQSSRWFVEQTVVAFLMQVAGGVPLDVANYVVNTTRQFYWQQDVDYDQIHTRHFTGPVRHLMYSKGYKSLLNQALSMHLEGIQAK